MPSQGPASSVVPAQLVYLTIYNPSFGDTDETAHEQILYYCSKKELEKEYQRHSKLSQHDGAAESKPDEASRKEDEQNERLRRVGLARGMVEFANTFSNGRPVDSIETEKSRLVLQELEPGWWILASIDLTTLPTAAKQSKDESEDKKEAVEYSSREVSPPQLLLKQLEQAHALFMLHHATTLNELYERVGRDLFCVILEKYWSRFVWDWDVLLHANPAVNIYNATKLAGGGELGIGVGEEEWGSGEREVLEDFVQRTEGLVDVVVGRYGDAPPDNKQDRKAGDPEPLPEPWLSTEDYPQSSDGIIFSGVGALSKRSLATVSHWMEAIFRHGDNAYGVGDNPTSRPRQRRKRRRRAANGDAVRGAEQAADASARVKSPRGSKQPDLRRRAMENNASPPGVPPPLVGTVERSLDQAIANAQKREGDHSPKREGEQPEPYFDTDKMMSYLKLGYGSSWTLNPKGFQTAKEDEADAKPASDQAHADQQDQVDPQSMQELDPIPDISDEEEEVPFVQRLEQSIGKFLIGLSGDLENTEFEDDPADSNTNTPHARSRSQRLFLRTLTLQLSRFYQSEHPDTPTRDPTSTKLRVVIYVHQPFIFTFLFDLQTSQLSIPSFYRSIHHQLGPLQKPLLRSTDPSRIPERIAQHVTINPSAGTHAEDIERLGLQDLIYDPVKLTVRTSIPNIPMPGTLAAEGMQSSSARTVSGHGTPSASPSLPPPSTTSSTRSPSASLTGATTSTYTNPNTNPSIDANIPNKTRATTMTDWTRIEALNVHAQILSTYIATRPSHTAFLHGGADEFERTVRSSRGWWVVWMRVPRSLGEGEGAASAASAASASVRRELRAAEGYFRSTNSDFSRSMRSEMEGVRTPRLKRDETDETEYADAFGGEGREAFLIRRSVDASTGEGRGKGTWSGNGSGTAGSGSRSRWLSPRRDGSGASADAGGGGGVGAKGVVEGVGVDARRWVEGVGRLS